MTRVLRLWPVLVFALAAPAAAQDGSLDIPVDYRKLDNGL